MNRRTMKIWMVILLPLLFSGMAFAQMDEEGCQDYPMFTRMPGFYIYSCSETDWNSVDFVNEKGENLGIEGKVTVIEYGLKEGAKEPSPLQIIRNYENAIKRIGGKIVFNEDPDKNKTWLEFEKAGKKINVYVLGNWGGYTLTIVERKAMEQVVVADPESLASDISARGHASVYGIYFDVDSDAIKPESKPSLKAIADMLKTNSGLKVYVVGHTDMTGSIEHNMDLSLRRAKSVVKALVDRYGIPANRLQARGIGPLAPVGTNRTEEGKKLNRRVELVEML